MRGLMSLKSEGASTFQRNAAANEGKKRSKLMHYVICITNNTVLTQAIQPPQQFSEKVTEVYTRFLFENSTKFPFFSFSHHFIPFSSLTLLFIQPVENPFPLRLLSVL
jgi:hypothetical protein